LGWRWCHSLMWVTQFSFLWDLFDFAPSDYPTTSPPISLAIDESSNSIFHTLCCIFTFASHLVIFLYSGNSIKVFFLLLSTWYGIDVLMNIPSILFFLGNFMCSSNIKECIVYAYHFVDVFSTLARQRNIVRLYTYWFII